jgi:predicted ATPase
MPGYANRLRLVGRDAELSGVEEVLRRKPPATIVVLIEGEPGIGKTSLWQEVLHRADDHGYRVISCRPAESEAQFAFTALTDLLAEAVEDILSELPRPQQHALEVALLRAEPRDRPPDQRAVAMAFLWSLRRLATAGPLVVAVDDVQWLDSSSAMVLEFAFRRLRQEPVVLLLTLRSLRDRGLPEPPSRTPAATRAASPTRSPRC